MLAEEGEERQRGDGGEERVEERGHISILLTAFLFSLTHSLSQTHPLLRGRQEREGAGRGGGWRRGERIMLEGGEGG